MLPKFSKKILIFESSLEGHRRHYLDVISKLAGSHQDDLVFYLPDDGEIDFKGGTMQRRITAHPSKGVGCALARLYHLAKALISCRPSVVLIPTADGLAQMLPLLMPLLAVFRCRVICVLHRAKFGYPATSPKALLIKAASYAAFAFAGRCTFYSVDGVPVAALKTKANLLKLRISYLPDPLTAPARKNRVQAREELGLPPDRLIVGCIGVIDCRKGVDKIIEEATRIDDQAFILLAGNFHKDIEKLLAHAGPEVLERFILVNRFLETDDMFTYIAALDGMLMLQSGHTGISSFALHSVNYGIPVICSDTPWFRFLESEFKGLVTVTDARGAIADQINAWMIKSPAVPADSAKFDKCYSEASFLNVLKLAMTNPAET